MVTEIRRDTVRLGLDLRPIPVDVGDGIEWEFTSDPSPEQWAGLVESLSSMTKLEDNTDVSGEVFATALSAFTVAMGALILNEKQRDEWVAKGYGLGPQQAISQALMELWTGFPTKQQSPSGEDSNPTG